MTTGTDSPSALPDSVRRLLTLQLQSEDLELPLLSDSATQVLSICNDEACDARGLAAAIERDQSLAGHVLRVSNSAAYAPKEPIVSLQQAISRLGFATICEIALAVSLKGRVFQVPGHKVRIRDMWMHSAATAVYAREVARLLRVNVEGAFLCGLLHDVGRPLVLQILVDVARQRTDRTVPSALLEVAMDEFHEEVGETLVTRWGLPEWIGKTVRHHHDWQAAGDYRTQSQVTRLADLLAEWALDVNLTDADFPAEDPLLEELNLYGDDLMGLLALRGMVLEVTEVYL